MLTEDERTQIEETLRQTETPQSASIDALKIIQAHRGWVSDEALEDVSSVLGVDIADLDSAATFYNLIFRKPVGRHVILICDSISCWVMGEERMLDHLERKLGIQPGETTENGVFTLLPTVCLGHCDLAPVMMLDGEIIGNLTEEKIDRILAEKRES